MAERKPKPHGTVATARRGQKIGDRRILEAELMYLSGDKTIKQIAAHFDVPVITVNHWSSKQGWSTKRQMIREEVESQVAVRAAADILTARETAENSRLLALQELQRRLQAAAQTLTIRELTTTVATLTQMLAGQNVSTDELWEVVSACPQPSRS